MFYIQLNDNQQRISSNDDIDQLNDNQQPISLSDDIDHLNDNQQPMDNAADDASDRSMASGRGFPEDVDSADVSPSMSPAHPNPTDTLTTYDGWSIRPVSTIGSDERINEWLMNVIREAYRE